VHGQFPDNVKGELYETASKTKRMLSDDALENLFQESNSLGIAFVAVENRYATHSALVLCKEFALLLSFGLSRGDRGDSNFFMMVKKAFYGDFEKSFDITKRFGIRKDDRWVAMYGKRVVTLKKLRDRGIPSEIADSMFEREDIVDSIKDAFRMDMGTWLSRKQSIQLPGLNLRIKILWEEWHVKKNAVEGDNTASRCQKCGLLMIL
jgi:hypothetical protein